MESTRRVIVTYGLMSCFWLAVGQSAPANRAGASRADTAVYTSFFREVALLKDVSGSGSLNGQPTSLTRPKVKDAIGLTEAESQILIAVAADCEVRVRQFDNMSQPLIFDARLRILAGEDAASISHAVQQLNDLAEKHDEIVLDHVERLRTALGESPFATLDSWVRSRKQAESFFPLVSQKQ
jgi:hypothetical protein